MKIKCNLNFYHQSLILLLRSVKFSKKKFFSFSSINTLGSISGGTRVTIDGDGFIPTDTLVYIAGANYTHLGSSSYSKIDFTTPQEFAYSDLDLDVYVFVRTSQAQCLLPSCYFRWATRVTPYFRSVQPTHIRGRTNLTITCENIFSGGRTTVNASVDINGNICNITQIRNGSIACTVEGVEAGVHTITGSIDG